MKKHTIKKVLDAVMQKTYVQRHKLHIYTEKEILREDTMSKGRVMLCLKSEHKSVN